MTGMRVEVSSDILDWILRLSGKYAANLNHKHQSQLDEWRTGRTKPTLNQIKDMSRKLHVPFGYFFLNEPFDDTPKVFAHRTIGSRAPSKASRELIDTVTHMESIQNWMIEELHRENGDPLEFVGSLTSDSTTSQIVEKIRNILAVPVDWFRKTSDPHNAFDYLRDAMERSGVIVMMSGIVGNNTHRRLNPNEFRAFALVDKNAPLIFINRNDEPAAARLFSLVHEFVHILMGSDELYDAAENSEQTVSRLETACNRGAGEFLMPDADFVRIWRTGGMEDTEKSFPVSRTAIALRALNHGYLTKAEYDREVSQAAQQVEQIRLASKPTGGNYYSTQRSRLDPRFLRALSASITAGTTTPIEAYRLTGTNRFTFERILEDR